VISNNDTTPDFAVDNAIFYCVSAIAHSMSRSQYLASVPAALVEMGDQFLGLMAPEDQHKVAILFARQIWNSCPIPASDYHRDPLPKPRRNDKCACGSGLKFKQCCLNLPPILLDDLPIWAFLLEVLSEDQLHAALASKQIPLELYAEIGAGWLEDGKPTKTVRLLEPLFKEGLKIDPHLGYAMNVLCDAFDQLGHFNKKTKFLKRIASSNTAVSGDAWQRLTTILIDEGDLKAAAEAFKQAMRSQPEDPNLASLEVLLMIRQGKDDDHIKQRIRFWKQKLRRWGLENEPIMALLETAEVNPQSAFVAGIEHALDPAFIALRQWISDVLQPREVSAYGMHIMDLLEDDDVQADSKVAHNHAPQRREGILAPPPDIQEIERLWHELLPENKPFLTQSLEQPEAWEQTKWLSFLQQNEQAADSLSILDDLVAILEGFPEIDWMGVADGIFEPIYDRARAILLKSIDAQGADITLPWPAMENRPALRLLYQRAMQSGVPGMPEEKQNLEELIKINPGDNHGVRTLLINHYLRTGDDSKALELAHAYPEDILVDLKFGEVLAHYRLGHQKESEALLRKAHYEHQLIARTLWRKRVKQPDLDPHSVTMGGEDEAWLYRTDMRGVWESTPGALQWLRKITS